MDASQIVPVVLSGGSGTRLWPASRAMYPKQLLSLADEKTMLQATVLRARGLPDLASQTIVVCNEAHRFSVAEQLAAIEQDGRLILEPAGRNTAPAIAIAALHATAGGDDPLLLVMPADHVIRDVSAFEAAVARGLSAARAGRLVTFGVVPGHPETGFGYIQAGPDSDGVRPVLTFVEKPDLATAESYLRDGNYYWNSGIFLFRASAFLLALKRFAPDILEACAKSMQRATPDGQFIRPDQACFEASPSDSIDYAVMEQADNVDTVPMQCGWSDVGSWSALHDVLATDTANNATEGDVLLHDCRDSLLMSESRLVAAIGLDNVIVIETKDSVLVADKRRSQDVKALVDALKAEGRPEVDLHRQVFRPWGSYDSLETTPNCKVKRLIVSPGAELSLQKHAHRSEHWVVLQGKARITRNDDIFDLSANESTYIATGDIHRIANPFDEPVHIIEVQCGDYLGEDDIVRIEDNYGREGTNH